MKNDDLIKAVTKCVKDKCDEKCPLYGEPNCEFLLLDEIMKSTQILKKDYLEYLQNKEG